MDANINESLFHELVACLESGDIDQLMEHYHEEAVLTGFDFAASGRDTIRGHMESYLARLGKVRLKSVDRLTETDDTILYEGTWATGIGEARVYEAFVLHDGKVTHQFTGVLSSTPVTE